MGGVIAAVRPGSIASELGLGPGDRVYAVGDTPVRDYIDYRFLTAEELIELRVARADGAEVVFEIEKDADDDLGIEFDADIFPPDRVRTCANRCLFCFVDRLPRGLRPALYVKDDDFRLSFLHGNFVTLTNLTAADENRIVTQRLSPLYVSVQATEPEVRAALLGRAGLRESEGGVLDTCRRLTREGITIHAQVVVCPGYNDRAHLDRTIEDLAKLRPGVASVGVVPVGLTRHGPPQDPVRLATPEEERDARERALAWHGRLGGFVYPADEYFLRAGLDVPPARFYADFPQLQNGIGLARKFLDDLARLERGERGAARGTGAPAAGPRTAATGAAEAIPPPAGHAEPSGFLVVTGHLARPLIEKAVAVVGRLAGLSGKVIEVENRVLGPSVTVAGLLFGKDVAEAVGMAMAGGEAEGTVEGTVEGTAQAVGARAAGRSGSDRRPVLVPGAALRAGSDELLDGETLAGLSRAARRPFLDAGWLPRHMLEALRGWKEGLEWGRPS